MKQVFTLSQRIELAKKSTSDVANMKDYRIRNKHNREQREAARELSNGRGYFIDGNKVYGYIWNNVYRRIDIAAF